MRHIVIGGLPRSGTSMLKSIIGSHIDVAAYIWEFPFWNDYHNRYKGRSLSQKKAKRIVSNIFNSEAIKRSDVSLNKEDVLSHFREPKEYYVEDIYIIFSELYLNGRKKDNLAIKNPYIEHFADEIFAQFPNTKFVHIVRNPLDNLVSLQKASEKWWKIKINPRLHVYEWRRSYRKLIKNQLKYGNNYYLIKYEDIVNEPSKSLKELCDFLEIDFDPDMLFMSRQPGWLGSNSSLHANKLSNTISNKSIGIYKKFLEDKTVNMYSQLLAKECKDLDYLQDGINDKKKQVLEIKFFFFSIWMDFLHKIKSVLKRTKIYDMHLFLNSFLNESRPLKTQGITQIIKK